METPEIPQKAPIRLEMEAGTYFWCTCGKSENQPFCDGKHKGSSFSPEKVVLEEAKTISWCACKHSGNGTFCDGSHKSL